MKSASVIHGVSLK